jgi:hypothetical protein
VYAKFSYGNIHLRVIQPSETPIFLAGHWTLIVPCAFNRINPYIRMSDTIIRSGIGYLWYLSFQCLASQAAIQCATRSCEKLMYTSRQTIAAVA